MSKRVMIVCVMVVWPSGMVTLHNREGDSGELGTHDYNGETSYIIPAARVLRRHLRAPSRGH